MRRNSIRPEDLVKENLRLYAADLEVLMEGRRYFVEVPCPACGHDISELSFVKGGFDHKKCRACDTLYISPRPPFDMLIDYYKTAKSIKHWNDVIFPATEAMRRREIFEPRAWDVHVACKIYGVPFDSLVDVGAGFGTFCMAVEKMGSFSRVIAVEPSPQLAETCRNRGLEVLEGAIEAVDLEAASVITAFELAEHLFCPRKFLEDCHRALVKDGLLIMTTPNIKGFDLVMQGAQSQNIGGPNHLQFFHPNSLTTLVEKIGLEVLSITTPGKLDVEIVRDAALSGELKLGPFLSDLLLDRWAELGGSFQKFLQDNNMSSHMMMIARKV